MNKRLLKIFVIVIIFMLAFSIKSFATENDKFSFENENINVELNTSEYITYSGGSGDITWASSDTSIATVESGRVKGLKVGTATITATKGSEISTCKVNVVYGGLTISGNRGDHLSSVNLFIKEHEKETLKAKVTDGLNQEISNVAVTWISADTSIVTVSSTGELKAVKEGITTVTAKVAGVEKKCEIKVYAKPEFTDFSKAKFETKLNFNAEILKVLGVTPKDEKNKYYYIITPTNSRPNIVKKDELGGHIATEEMEDIIGKFLINEDEKYLYAANIAKYTELKQDLYLWVIQEVSLEDMYYNEKGQYISCSSEMVVEGKKLERAQLPKLNLILQTVDIASFNNNNVNLRFNFPTETENRKFTLKIGRITDNSILNKIKNDDYTGITELLSYAKKDKAIYSENFITTMEGYSKNENTSFDGNKLLVNEEYYYIYIQFDDENGKYYPIEGVTLGQAWKSSVDSSWYLWAYTSSDFKWDNLTSTGTDSDTKKEEIENKNINTEKDDTIAKDRLPYAGINTVLIVMILIIAFMSIVFYKKNEKFIGIK